MIFVARVLYCAGIFGSGIWFLVDPGPEPVVVFLLTLAGIVGGEAYLRMHYKGTQKNNVVGGNVAGRDIHKSNEALSAPGEGHYEIRQTGNSVRGDLVGRDLHVKVWRDDD